MKKFKINNKIILINEIDHKNIIKLKIYMAIITILFWDIGRLKIFF